jgi:hypothetical protein
MLRTARAIRSSRSIKEQIATAARQPNARTSGLTVIPPINRPVVGTCARAGIRDGTSGKRILARHIWSTGNNKIVFGAGGGDLLNVLWPGS